ncbi:hypothetical protein [Sulfuriferula plumbiphila]|uniref:hypothetical protein n=1 Tax=Sulfuriferula plumbiphila TaxID=171865 RepID=UPI00135CFE61|nr:hypothetical protein [Sulfuriferula plumbiphila]BBP04781.1 hypothetical protein SFPGR_22030 [Sulfuriferula plumbiphila]
MAPITVVGDALFYGTFQDQRRNLEARVAGIECDRLKALNGLSRSGSCAGLRQ